VKLPRWAKRAALLTGIVALLAAAALTWGDPVRWWWAKRYLAEPGALITSTTAQNTLVLVPVAQGFERPVDLQFVPGRAGTAVVLEKSGQARVVDLSSAHDASPTVAAPNGTLLQVDVMTESELALLGLAFHPQYPTNGRLFVNYNPTGKATRTVVSEWHLPPAELGKQPAREVRTLREIPQPFKNHDGGGIAFGPDGKLYIGMGDGGAANDPRGHGQNLSTLLGAMLRLDVDVPADSEAPYRVPPDNPHVNDPAARPEIWAHGLRNPWRFSFDARGRVLVGDVGQNRFEEIDVVESGDNLGWNRREAAHCFPPDGECTTDGLRDPIFEYGRDLGTSVTGGFVYTGSLVPSLRGRYVFGDFTMGRIWSLEVPEARGQKAEARLHGRWPILISTFGRDPSGELYVVDHYTGAIFRIAASPGASRE